MARTEFGIVTKRVPANPLLDSDSLNDRSYKLTKNYLPPVRMTSAMMLVGENPVFSFAIPAAVSPGIRAAARIG
jgi:hypothetical protein